MWLVEERGRRLSGGAVGLRAVLPAPAPADDATIYDLASLTKPLATAALLALLAQERRVDIDTPAAEILGGLACANGRRPTLLDLATHRSGLPAWRPLWAEARGREDVLRAVIALPAEYPCGTKVVYSDMGYILLGEVLRRVSGRPIGELVQAARRIEKGQYETAVSVSGGEEFESLAATFNAMQSNIAAREADIIYHAHHDPLTQLPNRSLLKRSLERLLGGSAREAGAALVLIELRNLRDINASLGHQVGDEVLREAARRLKHNTAAHDTVARLGETQFLVLAPGCSAERALLYAEQLLAVVRSGFHLAEVSLDLRLACGVCLFPAHGASADELLQRVQVALEDADEARARVVMYRPGRDAEHRRRLTLITDLGGAIEQDRLMLVYQPKVTMATRWVKSLEALVRWTHPELGPVSPGEFVPLAESTGGSRRLTNWVLAAAIRQMGEWRRMGLELDLAVNLSAPDILDSDLGDAILALLRQHRVESSSLLLEITESAVMRDAQVAVRNMQLLRIAGVRFSIDDFGTGHSSLSQLSTLPVDELKIDRSFISEAASGSVTIVTSTIELGHRMGLKVVAEGVEDPAAWNLLRRLGCDFAQGYLISPPMPAAEVPAFIQQANQLLPASDSTLLQLRALEELAGRSGR